MTLYRRLTLIAEAGRIVKAFYPVFPPDRDAAEVLAWLARTMMEAPRIELGSAAAVRGCLQV